MTKPTKGVAVRSAYIAQALQRELGDDWKVFTVGGACGCYMLELILCPVPTEGSATERVRDIEWAEGCLRHRLMPGGKMIYV